jgi:nicotinate-nucleotide adenylyltransferase
MQIGLFGGTFNPIHNGHLSAAMDAVEFLGLDKLYLVPLSLPPHKASESIADVADRLEMIRLAVSDTPCFHISEVELNRSGPSYTIDTLHHFTSRAPAGTEFCLIMGIDAFLEIDTWKSYLDIFRLVPLIILSRPNIGFADSAAQWKTVGNYLKTKISGSYIFSASKSCFIHPEKMPVYRVDVTPRDVSSTKIRQLVKSGQSINRLVPESVNAFIQQKGLYR